MSYSLDFSEMYSSCYGGQWSTKAFSGAGGKDAVCMRRVASEASSLSTTGEAGRECCFPAENALEIRHALRITL